MSIFIFSSFFQLSFLLPKTHLYFLPFCFYIYFLPSTHPFVFPLSIFLSFRPSFHKPIHSHLILSFFLPSFLPSFIPCIISLFIADIIHLSFLFPFYQLNILPSLVTLSIHPIFFTLTRSFKMLNLSALLNLDTRLLNHWMWSSDSFQRFKCFLKVAEGTQTGRLCIYANVSDFKVLLYCTVHATVP